MTGNEYQKLAARTMNMDLKKSEQGKHALQSVNGQKRLYPLPYAPDIGQAEIGIAVFPDSQHKALHNIT